MKENKVTYYYPPNMSTDLAVNIRYMIFDKPNNLHYQNTNQVGQVCIELRTRYGNKINVIPLFKDIKELPKISTYYTNDLITGENNNFVEYFEDYKNKKVNVAEEDYQALGEGGHFSFGDINH